MRPLWSRVLGQPAFWSVAFAAGLALSGAHCTREGGGVAIAPPTAATGVEVSTTVAVTPGVLLDAEHTVGPPVVIGNLAVFPVYARVMEDIGDFLPLDEALERGLAEVREMGAAPQGRAPIEEEPQQLQQQAPPQQLDVPNPPQQRTRGYHGYRGDGAQVNTLVIESRAELPILVLAGTVVKGGKQDRQIGQDFIIARKQTMPVDAFCVEHGRWNAQRNGEATGGSFKSLRTLAVGDVRQAGQYQQDQGQVWAKVGKVNEATRNKTSSDTLLASLESPEALAERSRTGGRVRAFLRTVPMAERTVGLAYAVGGEVQGARWFIHHKVFAKFEETLVNTAVVDSFTARAQGQAGADGACAPEKVAAFIAGASKGREENRKAGDNENRYQYSDEAYASEARMKAPSPAAAPKSVTKDFLKKK